MFRSAVTTIATIAALSSASLASYADTYASAGFNFQDYEESVSTLPVQKIDSPLTAIFARVGKRYTENFSAEVRLGVGLGDDEYQFDGLDTGLKLSIREFYGAYLRGGVQVAERFYPYAVVGYSQATFELGDESFSVHENFGGVSYGAGVDVGVKQDLSANIEYMHYFDTVGIELTGFSVGLTRSF